MRFIKVKNLSTKKTKFSIDCFYLAGMTALCDGTLKPEVKQKSFFWITLQRKNETY